ncbi:hypothetical protein HK101_007520 [Irineochytrium annulatum]|nr:hypothetical protein HK101_007520 [Irineochytrium annulatum]
MDHYGPSRRDGGVALLNDLAGAVALDAEPGASMAPPSIPAPSSAATALTRRPSASGSDGGGVTVTSAAVRRHSAGWSVVDEKERSLAFWRRIVVRECYVERSGVSLFICGRNFNRFVLLAEEPIPDWAANYKLETSESPRDTTSGGFEALVRLLVTLVEERDRSLSIASQSGLELLHNLDVAEAERDLFKAQLEAASAAITDQGLLVAEKEAEVKALSSRSQRLGDQLRSTEMKLLEASRLLPASPSSATNSPSTLRASHFERPNPDPEAKPSRPLTSARAAKEAFAGRKSAATPASPAMGRTMSDSLAHKSKGERPLLLSTQATPRPSTSTPSSPMPPASAPLSSTLTAVAAATAVMVSGAAAPSPATTAASGGGGQFFSPFSPSTVAEEMKALKESEFHLRKRIKRLSARCVELECLLETTKGELAAYKDTSARLEPILRRVSDENLVSTAAAAAAAAAGGGGVATGGSHHGHGSQGTQRMQQMKETEEVMLGLIRELTMANRKLEVDLKETRGLLEGTQTEVANLTAMIEETQNHLDIDFPSDGSLNAGSNSLALEIFNLAHPPSSSPPISSSAPLPSLFAEIQASRPLSNPTSRSRLGDSNSDSPSEAGSHSPPLSPHLSPQRQHRHHTRGHNTANAERDRSVSSQASSQGSLSTLRPVSGSANLAMNPSSNANAPLPSDTIIYLRALHSTALSLHCRLGATETSHLNRRLRRAFDLRGLTRLSQSVIANIGRDVGALPARFPPQGTGGEEGKVLGAMVLLVQGLLADVALLRATVNDISLEYYERVIRMAEAEGEGRYAAMTAAAAAAAAVGGAGAASTTGKMERTRSSGDLRKRIAGEIRQQGGGVGTYQGWMGWFSGGKSSSRSAPSTPGSEAGSGGIGPGGEVFKWAGAAAATTPDRDRPASQPSPPMAASTLNLATFSQQLAGHATPMPRSQRASMGSVPSASGRGAWIGVEQLFGRRESAPADAGNGVAERRRPPTWAGHGTEEVENVWKWLSGGAPQPEKGTVPAMGAAVSEGSGGGLVSSPEMAALYSPAVAGKSLRMAIAQPAVDPPSAAEAPMLALSEQPSSSRPPLFPSVTDGGLLPMNDKSDHGAHPPSFIESTRGEPRRQSHHDRSIDLSGDARDAVAEVVICKPGPDPDISSAMSPPLPASTAPPSPLRLPLSELLILPPIFFAIFAVSLLTPPLHLTFLALACKAYGIPTAGLSSIPDAVCRTSAKASSLAEFWLTMYHLATDVPALFLAPLVGICMDGAGVRLPVPRWWPATRREDGGLRGLMGRRKAGARDEKRDQVEEQSGGSVEKAPSKEEGRRTFGIPKRVFMMLGCFGGAITSLAALSTVYGYDKEWVFIGTLIASFFGTKRSITYVAFAYFSDANTSPTQKTVGFSLLHAIVLLGHLTAPFFSGWMSLDPVRVRMPFLLAIALSLVSLVWFGIHMYFFPGRPALPNPTQDRNLKAIAGSRMSGAGSAGPRGHDHATLDEKPRISLMAPSVTSVKSTRDEFMVSTSSIHQSASDIGGKPPSTAPKTSEIAPARSSAAEPRSIAHTHSTRSWPANLHYAPPATRLRDVPWRDLILLSDLHSSGTVLALTVIVCLLQATITGVATCFNAFAALAFHWTLFKQGQYLLVECFTHVLYLIVGLPMLLAALERRRRARLGRQRGGDGDGWTEKGDAGVENGGGGMIGEAALWSDRAGTDLTILRVGCGIILVGNVLMGLANNGWQLFVISVFLGLGSTAVPLAKSLLARNFAKERQGRVFGMIGSVEILVNTIASVVFGFMCKLMSGVRPSFARETRIDYCSIDSGTDAIDPGIFFFVIGFIGLMALIVSSIFLNGNRIFTVAAAAGAIHLEPNTYGDPEIDSNSGGYPAFYGQHPAEDGEALDDIDLNDIEAEVDMTFGSMIGAAPRSHYHAPDPPAAEKSMRDFKERYDDEKQAEDNGVEDSVVI